jgi:hypothetical protein
MASDFPASLDAFPDPLVNSPLNSPSHAALHQDVNDAVEKIEVKLGVNASPASGASNGEVLMADGSGGSDWSNIGAGNIKTEGAAAGSLLVSDGAGSGAFVTNNIGLVLVKTQTVGTGVPSVTVTDAFNANFENYKITYSGGTQSVDSSLDILIGGSTTGYYAILVYALVTGSLTFAALNNSSSFAWVGGAAAGQASHADFELFMPFQARYTKIRNGQYQNGANYGVVNGEHRVATSYSSFTLQAPSGTMTGGTIRVYGYRNS